MCKVSCWAPIIFAGLLKLLSKGAHLATIATMNFVMQVPFDPHKIYPVVYKADSNIDLFNVYSGSFRIFSTLS